MQSLTSFRRLARRALRGPFHALFRQSIQVGQSADDSAFQQFIKPHFNGPAYLSRYSDVRRAGVDPLDHWLRFGVWEGRTGTASLDIVLDKGLEAEFGWQVFRPCGRLLSVRPKPDRRAVLDQILAQANFEPTVLAAGGLALAGLRTYRGDDLLARDGISVDRLYRNLPERVDVLVATPMLVAGGAEKYVADLLAALAEQGAGSIVVVVTEQTRKAAVGWERLEILAPLRGHTVLFWRDAYAPGQGGTPDHFARFAQSLRPSLLVVNNARIALDAVVRYGRGLSNGSCLCCTYFSISPMGLGAPYGARFPTWTSSHAISLTDNEVMHARLTEMTGALPEARVALVPPLAPVVTQQAFDALLQARRISLDPRRPSRRWVWVSRVEPAKGTEILELLARGRPQDQFDVYGPVEPHVRDQIGLDLPNVRLLGLITDVSAADFTRYDGFLFTSLFEGMPNVVLEMAQHAIPLVLADVGGLSFTFGDAGALLVRHGEDARSSATRFSDALDRVAAMSPDALERLVRHAYEQVVARHSKAAHRAAVRAAFGKEST